MALVIVLNEAGEFFPAKLETVSQPGSRSHTGDRVEDETGGNGK